MDFHPFIVHFPIAFLTLSALCDLVALLTSRDQFRFAGFLLLVLGTLGALAAAQSGDSAEHFAGQIPGIHEALEQHESLATVAIWAAVVLTLGRAHFVLKKRFQGAVCIVYVLLALGLSGTILATGYTGGKMVYEFGAGTAAAKQETGAGTQEPE